MLIGGLPGTGKSTLARDLVTHANLEVLRSDVVRKELAGLDPAGASNIVEETDHRRDQYVNTYYGRHRHDVVNYDLVVNTAKLGLDGAAAVIVSEAKRRRWD